MYLAVEADDVECRSIWLSRRASIRHTSGTYHVTMLPQIQYQGSLFVFSHWARRRGCFIHGVSDDMRMGTVVGFHCTDIVAARKLSSG